MPNSIFLVLLIELVLIVLTSVLLIQPKKLFKPDAKRLKSMSNWIGLIFLCLTFCWSVVLGVVLSMNGLSIRI